MFHFFLFNTYMLALLTLWNVAFILFFSFVGMRYMSFIPIFSLLIMILYMWDQEVKQQIVEKKDIVHFFTRHAFAFARACIMLWVWWVVNMIALDSLSVVLWLLWANILLRCGSYIIEYRDGKEMFHIGYWIASCLFLWTVYKILQGDMALFLDACMAWVALTTWLYGFVIFVWDALGWKVNHELMYTLFILCILCVIFLIYEYTSDDIMLTLVLSQVMLMALYCGIFGICRYHDRYKYVSYSEQPNILRSILSWKKVHSWIISQPTVPAFLSDMYGFLTRVDNSTKFTIWFFNILLILGQVYVFMLHISSSDALLYQIFLWFGIVSFFVNYLLLKQIGFAHTIQRVLAFVLLNFGIYLTIVRAFWRDPSYIVTLGTLWSIVNGIIMLHTWWLAKKWILQWRDYFYWMWSNVLVTLCNIYFMFLLPFALELKFFIVLIYIGIQTFLTFSNLRYARLAEWFMYKS